MKKSLLAILLALMLTLCFTACGNSNEADNEPAEVDVSVTGGWEVNPDMPAAQLDEYVQKYFNAATANYEENVGDGIEYTPVELLATQEGAGSAYWVLCKTDDTVPLKIMSYAVDMDENVGFETVSDFDPGDYTETNDPVDHSEADWSVKAEKQSELPEDVQKAFDGAFEGFTGSQVEPVLYLGSQVVAGTNYSILCKTTTVTENPVTNIAVVTIYADLDGNYEITGICNIDLSQF